MLFEMFYNLVCDLQRRYKESLHGQSLLFLCRLGRWINGSRPVWRKARLPAAVGNIVNLRRRMKRNEKVY